MRTKQNYQILTFHTTTAAMAMEDYCHEQKIPGRLIPLPQEISAGCGLASVSYTHLDVYKRQDFFWDMESGHG